MKTVFIHAGTHKAGSTSLQHFLANASGILADQGILYPKSGRPNQNFKGHHLLSWYLLGKNNIKTDESWKHLRDEIVSWKGDRVVISSEDLETITVEQILRIQSYLAGCDLNVIIYLRNPFDFLVSVYKQLIKSGVYGGEFLNDFLPEKSWRADYGPLVDRWSKVLGPDKVHLRIFDKVKKKPGIERDFCSIIGVNADSIACQIPTPTRALNISPSNRKTAILLRFNKLTWRIERPRRFGRTRKIRTVIIRKLRAVIRGDGTIGKGYIGKIMRLFLGIGVYSSLQEVKAIEYLRRSTLNDRHNAFLERYIEAEDHDFLKI